jgi:hypothetical protein
LRAETGQLTGDPPATALTGRRVLFGAVLAVALAAVSAAAAVSNVATAAKVSVGSPSDQTPRNHQNEPAIAVDAHNPDFLVAASIDYIDQQPCPQNLATRTAHCEDFPGVGAGFAGVYFSFNRGKSWTQPTYTGWTARACTGSDLCAGYFGPIGTVPWWYEAGLLAAGDPAVAIGPRPAGGRFSWTNGSRVYYASLAADFKGQSTLKGYTALAVSRLDNPTPSSVGQKSSWMPPILVEGPSSTAFSDKEQIWVDNAESSPFFGNAYMCFNQSDGNSPSNYPNAQFVATSTDGGDRWKVAKVTPGHDITDGLSKWGYFGCTIRTDSHGVAYLFTERAKHLDPSKLPLEGQHVLLKSFDGGKSWTKPQPLFSTIQPCHFIDPLSERCVMDGYTGARTTASAAPAVDIANGAPTGADATNLIIDAWSDGSAGVNNEQVRLSWSTDGGDSWHTPTAVSLPGDRPLYAAPAVSPAGDRAYVVYEAVTSPWRGSDMNSPRPYHGVFLTAPVGAGGPGPWTTAYNGPLGDLRASYPGHRLWEERVGDYVYAAASRDYGVGVWIDARDAAVCPAIQDWRGRSLAAGAAVIPAPWPLADCPATFGNTDVWAATTG